MLNNFIKRNPKWALMVILVLAITGLLLSGFSIINPGIIYLCWFIWVVSYVYGLRLYSIRDRFSAWHERLMVYLGLGIPVLFAIGVTMIYVDITYMNNLYCKHRMLTIAQAISDCCTQNDGSFPEVSQWCDSLVSDSKKWPRITRETFQCPDVKEGLSGYAINKKLEGKKINGVTPNTVILFEAVPGWNQNGGQELIRFNKHSFPPGLKKLNVICTGQDGPKYMTISKRDVDNLKWEP